MNQTYIDTARLLTQVAPIVFQDGVFALKGGTAINLFVRDMPRLSVDLDLVIPDYTLARDEALARINDAIRSAADRLIARGYQTRTVASTDAGETKLMIRRGSVEVKVEVNYVLRGTVHPVKTARLVPKAREILMADLELPVVSIEDLYGGKLVAAMDRQHPRDLFDCAQLFENEGITPGIRQAFVVYLACHNRPVHEVLFPTQRDISQEYQRTFKGMTAVPVELEELISIQDRLMRELQQGLDANERKFLISLVRNQPDWQLLEIPHLSELPGIQWKLKNLERLANVNSKAFEAQAERLGRILR